MATALNRISKQFLASVNTPDYPVEDWIINPDMTAVAGYPAKYWSISGDTVSLLDQSARDAVDAQIAADLAATQIQADKDRYDSEAILRAVIKLTVDQLNVLRAEHALPDLTYAQVRTAIFNAIDGGV